MSKVDTCGICGKRVMENSVLCVKCGKWIHGNCAKVKRVTPKLGGDFLCGKCEKRDEGMVEEVEELYEEVEMVRSFFCLGIGWIQVVTARQL